MVGVVVLIGVLVAGFGFSGLNGDVSTVFSSNNQPSNNSGETRYITEYRWVTVDNSYISPQYNDLFLRLDVGTKAPDALDGFNIDYQEVTADNWVKFCKLSKENEEFNAYAGQLLYSQYLQDQLAEELSVDNIYTNIRNRNEYSLIFKSLGLKEQDKFNVLHKNIIYKLTDWYRYGEPIKNNDQIYKNLLIYENLLNNVIQSGDFSDNEFDTTGHINFYDVIKKTVNGSLCFWDWKQNRKFDDYSGKQPLRFSNGGNRCWVQAGAQVLIASTANDDLSTLGNWGKFIKKLSNIQDENRNKTIEFVDVLKSFCYSNEFDLNEISRNDVNVHLKLLENGGTAHTATTILLNIFPKLKQVKFDTKKVTFEQPIDPILSAGVATDKKTYLPADPAIRHLIPNVKNVNAGVGSDPQDVTNVTNQYAKYKIEYSPDNKLMIYELRGMTLTEHLPIYNKIPANEVFDNKERYTVDLSRHARAVVKLDNSSSWHYCDSNRIYFVEKNLENVFYNSKSIVDYVTIYKDTKPANHADLLMYELVN